MKVKKGKKYEICVPYIHEVAMTCFVIEANEKKDIDRIKAYLKHERTRVKEL